MSQPEAASSTRQAGLANHQFRSNQPNEIQYESSSSEQTTSAYYPPETQQMTLQHQHPAQVSGMAFDLNAVGDEDEDVDGQMHQVCKDRTEAHEMNESDEADRRSVFVGNVDYGTTPPELQEHFKNCGAINRITIMVDRYTGHPKGYAYVEFQDESAIPNAVSLNESTFRDRQLKVTTKRKNVPGYATRGRGGYGAGAYGAGAYGAAAYGTAAYGTAAYGGGVFMRGGGSPFMGRGAGSFRGAAGGFGGRGRKRGVTGYSPWYRGRGGRGGVVPY